jgi:plastocyanin
MATNHSDDAGEDIQADTSSVTSRRRLLGLMMAGVVGVGTSATVVSAARHDDHDDDSDHDRDDHDDEHRDDHDDDDHRDDDDDPGRPAVQLADGSWEVRITDDDADAFLPGKITIQPGESVTWVNNDDKPHTATGAGWDTGTLQPGESATVEFAEAGTFNYSCQIHPVMTGSVVVGDAAATPAASPVATPAAAGSAVRIFNLAYEPPTLEVAVGTTVTWTNDDSLPHTATSSDGDFDTNTIAAGATAELTFDTAGTFEYVCAFHPGMVGTIVVS